MKDNKNKWNSTWKFFLVITILSFLINILLVQATPEGPEITIISNETGNISAATIINTTGGSITTMTLDVDAQNLRWKAYVGNVTGSLSLDDSDSYSIYDWDLTTVSGEVYATRASDAIDWSSINCSNTTHIGNEEEAINHTSNPDDNISATFNYTSHESFYVATNEITANSCFSLYTNVNNQSQNSSFQEVLLYDGIDDQNGEVVYATILEQDVAGYNNEDYDFQMIVPEIGLATWDSSTAYYFYVELS